MPNRDTHLGIAIMIGIVWVAFAFIFGLEDYIMYGWGLFFGAVLPDILDPWTEENRYDHRGFWHSRRLLRALYILLPITLFFGFAFNWIFAVFFIIVGYISHLWADSYRPTSWSRGLPY